MCICTIFVQNIYKKLTLFTAWGKLGIERSAGINQKAAAIWDCRIRSQQKLVLLAKILCGLAVSKRAAAA